MRRGGPRRIPSIAACALGLLAAAWVAAIAGGASIGSPLPRVRPVWFVVHTPHMQLARVVHARPRDDDRGVRS
jgi:hypothetical protein